MDFYGYIFIRNTFIKGGLSMCTHINLKNKNGDYLCARTMDFSFELDPFMAFFPRKSPIIFTHYREDIEHYAFLGLSKLINGEYIVADGINEHGLSCSSLYFEGYADYNDEKSKDLKNVAPYEIPYWTMMTCKNVEDFLLKIKDINILDTSLDFIGKTPPLHWVLCDKSGNSVVVESIGKKLNIHDNKIGVLTNSPDYDWHITNLRNYIGLTNIQREPLTIGGLTLAPFGQGAGAYGLPGDFTPTSRFVRTVFNKQSCIVGETTDELVIAATNILNNVTIPKGTVKTKISSIDYTQYVSYMSLNTLEYFFKTYENNNINRISLRELDLDGDEILTYEIKKDLITNNIIF